MRYYWSTKPDLFFDAAMKGRLTEGQANRKDKTWTVSQWKWLFSFVPAAKVEIGLGVQLHNGELCIRKAFMLVMVFFSGFHFRLCS